MKNERFKIELAGRTVGVTCLHPSTRDFCAGYLGGGTPDLEITVSQPDIDWERTKSASNHKYKFSDEYLETLAVYRKIAEKMPYYDTILFHGSAVAVDGTAYLFTAASGTGKSTHARLWREYLGSRAVMVNDDKPLIRLYDGQAVVCGTPWNGKHKLGGNVSAPLRAVCVLTRAESNSIRRVSKREAYSMLVQQSYRPADKTALALTLSLIDRLADSVKLYLLGCNMEPEAAEISYNAMKGE